MRQRTPVQVSALTSSGTCPVWFSAPGGYECFQSSLGWGWNRFHNLPSPGVLSTSRCCISIQNIKKKVILFPLPSLRWISSPAGTYLFDMEEVFSLEGDGHAWQGDVIVVAGAVVDICANSKCNWFGLPRGTKDEIDEISDCAKKYTL